MIRAPRRRPFHQEVKIEVPIPTLDSLLMRRSAGVLVCALVVAALVAWSGLSLERDTAAPLVNPLDRLAIDLLSNAQRESNPLAAQNDPVIIGIDESTVAALSEPPALWHRHLGRLITGVAASGASAFGYDLALPDRLYGSLVPGIDQALIDSIIAARKRVPIVFARTLDSGGAPRRVHAAYLSAAGEDERFGLASFTADADGVVRRFEDRSCAQDARACTFAGALAASVGLRRQWSGYVPYAFGAPFEYLSMIEVSRWIEAGEPAKLASALSNRVVLLGVVLPSEQRQLVPLGLVARDPDNLLAPRVMLHAQVLRAMLNRDLMQPVAFAWVALLALGSLACWWGRRWPARLAILGAYVALAFGIGWIVLLNDQYLPVATLMLCGAFTSLFGAAFNKVYAQHARSRLQRALSDFFHPEMLRQIERGVGDYGIRADRGNAAVLVARVADFGGLGEGADPMRLAVWLNGHLARIDKSVRAHSGRVSYFTGDSALAVFGPPDWAREPERSALEAAQDLLVSVARFRAELGGNAAANSAVTIGIASGPALIGRIGAFAHEQWLPSGPVVELARALQVAAAERGTPVLCSSTVADAVGRPAFLRPEKTLNDSKDATYSWSPELARTLHAAGSSRAAPAR